MVRGGVYKLALTGLFLFNLIAGNGAEARESAKTFDNATVAISDLPAQGIQTYRLIHQGGPFAYEKDGVVFGNRERLLPLSKRGYYREYTVMTPNARGRGARRVVCGGPATKPDACYYTADHYATFRKIVP